MKNIQLIRAAVLIGALVVGPACSVSPRVFAAAQIVADPWNSAEGRRVALVRKVTLALQSAPSDQDAWEVLRSAVIANASDPDFAEAVFAFASLPASRVRHIFSRFSDEVVAGTTVSWGGAVNVVGSVQRAILREVAKWGPPASLSANERAVAKSHLTFWLRFSGNEAFYEECLRLSVWPIWTSEERLEFATLNLQASRFEGASAYILGRLDDGAVPFMLAHVQARWADGQDVALPTIDRLTKREYLALKPTVDAMLATASQGGMCGGRPCSDFVSDLTSIQARLALPTMPTQDILAYIESADGSRSVGYGAADEQRVRAVKVLVRRGVALSTIRQSILTFAVKLKGDGQPNEDWSRSPATLAIFKSNVFPLGVLEKDDIPEARLIPASSMIGPQTVWP